MAEEGGQASTGKSLAIVVGGVAALVLVAIFFLFLKSLRRKGDGTFNLLLFILFEFIYYRDLLTQLKIRSLTLTIGIQFILYSICLKLASYLYIVRDK